MLSNESAQAFFLLLRWFLSCFGLLGFLVCGFFGGFFGFFFRKMYLFLLENLFGLGFF